MTTTPTTPKLRLLAVERVFSPSNPPPAPVSLTVPEVTISTISRGVLVTVTQLPSGEVFATTSYKGADHGHSIPPGTIDPVSYAVACALGIARHGLDGRKAGLSFYKSASL